MNATEMVTALRAQWTTKGRGGRMSTGDSSNFFFVTQRVRMRLNGWKPGYGFEFSVRIRFLNRATHPKLEWGVSEGREFRP